MEVLASLVAQRLKRLPATWETWVRPLGREDPLEKAMATHSSTLAWRIPWTEEPGRLQSMGPQRFGHDWVASLTHSCKLWDYQNQLQPHLWLIALVKVKLLSRVWLFATPWTVDYLALPSMGFSRQEYWSGLPLPSPGDLPDPRIEPWSPAFQADALTSEPPGENITFFRLGPKSSAIATWLSLLLSPTDWLKIRIPDDK